LKTASLSLSLAFFFTTAAHAIPIPEFNKLPGPAKDKYVNDLVRAAEKSLNAAGRSETANKVEHIFADSDEGAQYFYKAFGMAWVHDTKTGDHTDVMTVLAVVLHRIYSIELPDSYYTLAEKIRPGAPPTEPGKSR
jgi:hypothetical protein